MDVILIRGAPGVGKSTVAELLRTSAPAGAVVDIDDVRMMINRDEFLCDQNDDYANAIRGACAMVDAFAELGYGPIVVVDVFWAPMLELFKDHMRKHKTVSMTLCASDEVLSHRIASRASGYRDLEVAKRVNRHITSTRDRTDAWIDTSIIGPHHVLAEVLDALKRVSAVSTPHRIEPR